MSIKQSFLKKLTAQADEAELQNLPKIAEALTTVIAKNASNIRTSDVKYSYSSDKFHQDIEENLWNIVVRAADFYNNSFDAAEIQPMIESYATSLILELKNKLGTLDGIGAYETPVLGEINNRTSMKLPKTKVKK